MKHPEQARFDLIGHLFKWLLLIVSLALPAGLIFGALQTTLSVEIRVLLAFVALPALVGAFQVCEAFVRWRRSEEITDPVFGCLSRYSGSAWHGVYDSKQEIALVVQAGSGGPSERQRQLFVELEKRFEDLNAALETPLFEAHRDHRNNWLVHCNEAERQRYDLEHPPLLKPGDIWSVAHLVSVTILDCDHIDIGLAYFADDRLNPPYFLLAQVYRWKIIDVDISLDADLDADFEKT